MTYTEEHVTRAVARKLVGEGWEVVAVHPPDGQGPFVIPKPPRDRRIERSSFHPDLVAVRSHQDLGAEIIIVECKLNAEDLASDYEKLRQLASSRFGLLFALFRCQKFNEGPEIGVDFEAVSLLSTEDLPVQFGLAAMATHDSVSHSKIESFACSTYLFSERSLR